jgi:hypothetical protein
VRHHGTWHEVSSLKRPVVTNSGADVFVGAGQCVDPWGNVVQFPCLGTTLKLTRKRCVRAGKEDFGI